MSSNRSLIIAASSSNMTHSLPLLAVVLAPISSTAGFQLQTLEAYSLKFSAKHYAVSGQGSNYRGSRIARPTPALASQYGLW